jgi:DNA-binding transcriptional LysR family regulator
MTLKELELFYYLSKNPHISNLANSISMSQSAISLAIKSLEKKLGEKLFDRVGKKLVLNERGRLFKENTYTHFLALQDAKDIFLKDKISGILKIASSKTIGNYIMPQIIFDFLSTHPQTTIQNSIHNSKEIIKMVLDSQIDIGFIESTCDEIDIIKQKFNSDNLVVVSSDNSLKDKSYYIDQLFSKKWILREKGSGTRDIFLNNLGNISNDLTIFMQYNDFEEIKSILTKNQDTITCISKYVVQKELKNKELCEIDIKNLTFKRDFYIIYHKDKYKSRLFDEFWINFFKD